MRPPVTPEEKCRFFDQIQELIETAHPCNETLGRDVVSLYYEVTLTSKEKEEIRELIRESDPRELQKTINE
ncbi:hypothetical protein IMZ31_23780 (plasmid) [Pontibacillus sp. ALD_SL1]|uniref:hypothetical protein n=1 Tax=Pontibacillus sp. ALD_SL1 TaxID=2777185 RepID=UPI001A978036|nr:hypothetical protein [Pontibacillus sp. ALD_SL1]QST02473.1 hypothetical protein IMZ31_23780 [Pontibacillus sp. ALD_SL1]